jgi:hypothetical protein
LAHYIFSWHRVDDFFLIHSGPCFKYGGVVFYPYVDFLRRSSIGVVI